MTRMRRTFPMAIGVLASAALLALPGCELQEEQEVARFEDDAIAGADEPGPFGTGGGEEGADLEGRVTAEEPVGEAPVAEARELVREATRVAEQMRRDPQLAELMQQARGIFIVPSHGRAAAIVGVRGGEGVLLARDGEQWSDPVFYDVAAISVGAQIGAEGGEIAMLLMNEQVVDRFKGNENFSLDADAGFTLVDYSARAQESIGMGGDVVLWSDAEGAFAGVSLGVRDISWDDEENAAFYDQMATAEDVLSGKVTSREEGGAEALQRALL